MNALPNLLSTWLCVFLLVNAVSALMARHLSMLRPIYQRALMTAIIVPAMVYGILPLLAKLTI